MGLTSRKLQILIALIAVICFVATVWIWPRLSDRNWRSLLGRVGLLVVGQVFTLAAIGLAANNWGAFYSSWNDLFGTDAGNGAPVTINGGVHQSSSTLDGQGNGVQVLNSKPVPLKLHGANASGGTLQEVNVKGGSTGFTEDAYVYLPPQYGEAAYAHTRFPVMLVFTGYPGSPKNLVTRMQYPTVAAQAIQEKQMQPTILVLMRPAVNLPRDTECQDVPNGPQAETFFTKDLQRAVTTDYRAESGGAHWGVIGDSTGGYCALKLSMRHPEAFSAAASLSGYYASAVDSTTGDLFGGSQQLRNENDLMWRMKHLPMPRVSLLVASSLKGEGDYKATVAFAAAAKPPLEVSTMYLAEGGHNFGTWNKETPPALRWLSSKIGGPVTGGVPVGKQPS
ncbi:alpha/beta hydrolase [Streptacidiphilus carbonis]|uniref:alpha/beta hydrolase n=1 Tax=Streptacidiphilus carbonis TaxID=105422 RepID=UPI0005A832C8|nr:alpha/beta hydrolase-fold protein [Streptacidiphilus carbonis]